jgi:hypothetical protein
MLAGRQVSGRRLMGGNHDTTLSLCPSKVKQQSTAWPPPCPTWSDNNARDANDGHFASRNLGAQLRCFVCRVTDVNLPLTSGRAVPGTDPKPSSTIPESSPPTSADRRNHAVRQFLHRGFTDSATAARKRTDARRQSSTLFASIHRKEPLPLRLQKCTV